MLSETWISIIATTNKTDKGSKETSPFESWSIKNRPYPVHLEQNIMVKTLYMTAPDGLVSPPKVNSLNWPVVVADRQGQSGAFCNWLWNKILPMAILDVATSTITFFQTSDRLNAPNRHRHRRCKRDKNSQNNNTRILNAKRVAMPFKGIFCPISQDSIHVQKRAKVMRNAA